MDVLTEIWTLVQDTRGNLLRPLDNPIPIYNELTDTQYTLTHRLTHSNYAFRGCDDSGASRFIKILNCKSFAGFKAIHQRLQALRRNPNLYSHSVRVLDYFEFQEEQSWGVVFVTEWLEVCSVIEVAEVLQTHRDLVSKALCLMVFSQAAVIARLSVAAPLQAVYPEFLLLVRQSESTEHSWNAGDWHFTVRFSSIGRRGLGLAHPQSEYYTESNDSWGALLSFYCLVVENGVQKLKDFRRGPLDAEDVKFCDPAIDRLISLQANLSHIFVQQCIDGWIGLLRQDPAYLQHLTFEGIKVLHSGLLLDSVAAQQLAVLKLLELASDSPSRIVIYLNAATLWSTIFKICSSIDWDCHEVKWRAFIEIVFRIKHETWLYECLRAADALPLITRQFSGSEVSPVLLEVISSVCEGQTLTGIGMVLRSGLFSTVLRIHSQVFKHFIRGTAPYCGLEAAALIQSIDDDALHSLEQLLEVPPWLKLARVSDILDWISLKLKRKELRKTPEFINTAIKVIADTVCYPKLTALSNQRGTCHINELWWSRVKTPFALRRCEECQCVLCTFCFNAQHRTHQSTFLYYNSQCLHCQCKGCNSGPGNVYILPKYNLLREEVEPVAWWQRSPYCSLISGSNGQISINLSLTKALHEIFYFEVRICNAGSQEDIVIEETNSGIQYHTATGLIAVGGQPRLHMHRAGSFDTIGLGLTLDSLAFVTLNGVIACMFELQRVPQEIRPVFQFNGSECEVELVLGHWLFQRYTSEDELPDELESKLYGLLDQMKKMISTQNADGSAMLEELARFIRS